MQIKGSWFKFFYAAYFAENNHVVQKYYECGLVRVALKLLCLNPELSILQLHGHYQTVWTAQGQ